VTPQRPGAYPQRAPRVPDDATELLLIRHGQSEDYVDGAPFPLVGGHGDPALSDLGRDQAARLCARLAVGGVDAMYVTPLRRTTQTAAPLATSLGLEPRVEADLREVYLGEWEGGEYRKMMATDHPIGRQVLELERWDVIPGAEPADKFGSRVQAALGKLAAAHPGQQVAVFTHGGVIAQALALATGSRPFAFAGADNASISRLIVSAERWFVRSFNDTAHLDRA
jgi:2,3-bisphosphoglycerate-dependent phosphoglycerate mutase